MVTNPNNTRWVSWHLTREDRVILNIDGSSIDNLVPSGVSGLLSNSDGVWLWGFTGYLGRQDNLFAELMDIHNGLDIAWQKGHQRLICYSDSLLAIILCPLWLTLTTRMLRSFNVSKISLRRIGRWGSYIVSRKEMQRLISWPSLMRPQTTNSSLSNTPD